MHKSIIKTVLFIFLVSLNPAYADSTWVSFPGGTGAGPPSYNVVESDAEHTVVEVYVPGVWVDDIDESGESFQRVVVPEYEYVSKGDLGKPEIPGVGEFVAVPGNKGVTFNVVETAVTVMENYWLYPLQPDFTWDEGLQDFIIDTDFYENYQGFYKEDFFNISDPFIWRDLRVVSFDFNPVRFNPATGEIEAIYYLKFELFYGEGSDVNVKDDPDYPIEKTNADMYRISVLNYDNLGLDETGWDLDGPGKYLIITHPRYYDSLNPLTTWLSERGFSVLVKKTDEITGGNNPPSIHAFIAKQYEGYRTKYVLLVGTHEELPAALVPSNDHPAPYILSDHYYSCVAGSDLIPDVAVGRITHPHVSLFYFERLVDKIIRYSKTPAEGDWPGNVLLVADDNSFGGHKDTDPQKCKEYIRTYSGYDHFQPTFYCAYGREGATNETVTNFINGGAGVVNYAGHGDLFNGWYSWNLESYQHYKWPDAGAQRNDKYPFVFNCTCSNAKLDGAFESHCESWLGAHFPGPPYYGAIAAYGNSRLSYSKVDHVQDKQFFRLSTSGALKPLGT